MVSPSENMKFGKRSSRLLALIFLCVLLVYNVNLIAPSASKKNPSDEIISSKESLIISGTSLNAGKTKTNYERLEINFRENDGISLGINVDVIKDFRESKLIVTDIKNSDNEQIKAVFWQSNDTFLQRRVKECQNRGFNYDSSDVFYEADCGTGYDFKNSSGKYSNWDVVFIGSGFQPNKSRRHFSGCPNHCPLSPKCKLTYALNMSSITFEPQVIVMLPSEAFQEILGSFKLKPYIVLYWREAKSREAVLSFQRNNIDLEMGVHQTAAILNPSFLITPSELKLGLFQNMLKDPEHFAASIVSDCHSPSLREIYLERLVRYLGSERVHQYGNCGNRKLPPKPFTNALKVLSTYKLCVSLIRSRL